MKAVLKAKLVDKNGNPVVGQTVTFTMGVTDVREHRNCRMHLSTRSGTECDQRSN